jgi:NAD(P)-dependent dehydrogenase (short-subunit alcohol dehydrogenase family)
MFSFPSYEITNFGEYMLEQTYSIVLTGLNYYFLNRFDAVSVKSQLYGVGINTLQVLLSLRIFRKYVCGRKPKQVDLTGKVYIVTGSNTGIGFETAKSLVEMGATVILACRSLDRANDARTKVLEMTKAAPSKVIVIKLDLCGFDSVKKFVKEFKNRALPLHGLVNNAGIMMEERNLTQDGFEMVFTANHLSHFMLTLLLIKDLEKTGGRVVNLTSSLHYMAKSFNFDDIMSEKHYELFSTYAQSKLANVLFTKELTRRLQTRKSSVTCYAVHPGLVRTEVTRHMPMWMQVGNMLAYPIMICLQKTPAQGAYCSIYAATDPDVPQMNGGFFANSRMVAPSAAAEDTDVAKKLWEVSEKLTGLSNESW